MKKLFTLLFLTIALAANAQSPFARYPMNGNGNDVSGNNKNGVLEQIVPAPDRNNATDAALLFNAANGSTFKVSDTTGFGNGNGSVSVAAWFKCSGQGINSVFTSGMQGFANGIFMSVGYIFFDGSLSFALASEVSTTGLIFICSKEKYNDDKWYHVAVVVDKSSNVTNLYIDGKKAKFQNFSGFGQTGKGVLNTDSTELNITGLVNSSKPTQAYVGIGTSSGVTQNFTGVLDEVYYYKSAISEAQVAALYNGTASGIYKNNADNLFSVYPNPSNGIFHLKNNSNQASNIKIVNTLGKEVKTLHTSGLYDSIDLSDLTNGMYLLMFDNGSTLKIMKN